MRRKLTVVGLVLAILFSAFAQPASAWKPYDHNFTADAARADALDGMVTILGRDYTVSPRVVQALAEEPDVYNAGVVGPDAFPDFFMGQGVIHPGNSGEWLEFLYDQAWQAQASATYSEQEKLQILAFTYGFLTHAAGDMWAHTLVNDFAGGVFPDFFGGDANVEGLSIAVKHIILEHYIADATPGYDGNRHDEEGAGPAPGGDISDDSTHAIPMQAPPDKFIYDVFIARKADAQGHFTLAMDGQPSEQRGLLVNLIYDWRNFLSDHAGPSGDIQAAIDNFRNLQANIDAVNRACLPLPTNPLDCAAALGRMGFATIEDFLAAAGDFAAAAIHNVTRSYIRATIEDIDHGLQHWGQIGLTFARAWFDPQTRRDVQNSIEFCADQGSEGSQARIDCEEGVSTITDTLFELLEDNITDEEPHLASMVGLPDAVGLTAGMIEDIRNTLDQFVGVPDFIDEAQARVKDFFEETINDFVEETYGFDPETFTQLVKNPYAYLDPVHPPLPLPPPFDVLNNTGGLFGEGEHERLDTLIGLEDPGLTEGHHDLGDRRLLDEAELLVENFAPLENTQTMAKLVLLDGPELNQVFADILGRDIRTYAPRDNIMVTGFGGPWLWSMDSDHAWRADGQPRFPNRDAEDLGGLGNFPPWESCVLRPAFRELFHDWENDDNPDETDFPDLGDGAGGDGINDPSAPLPSIAQTAGAKYIRPSDGRYFVGGDNVFTVGASDVGGFPPESLTLRYRVYRDPDNKGPFVTAHPGDTFSITGQDGRWFVEAEGGDPCHDLETGAGGSTTREIWLDTTAPVVTGATPPFGSTYDTDDFATVDYSVDDGEIGSGVASESATIDGWDGDPMVPNTTRPTFDGDVLDMYLFYPGTRTVPVTATDNIGNTGTTPLTFELHATAESLISNVHRADSEGKIDPPPGRVQSLLATLDAAKRQHDRGSHDVEWNQIAAFVNELEAQRDQGVDLRTANRFIAYGNDLIAIGG